MSLSAALDFARASHDRILAELKDFLAIPSISTLSAHQPDMLRAAEWVAAQMRGLHLDDVQILPTGGHPAVYGESLRAPGRPTVLLYGHYDVQPVDPLNEWHSGPFAGEIRGENIYARGASDMKGQVLAFLKALEGLQQGGGLPINVKILIEGEEEIGSPSLGKLIAGNLDRLRCDVVLNADSGILRPDLPSIVYGLRGLAYFELRVQGAAHDLHSGTYGGTVHNPLQVLCELIAGMHDADGRVTLPGYYDRVRVLSDAERAAIARSPYGDADVLAATGAPRLYGETGYTTIERRGARPTLEVNGLLGGFTGEGAKTVLPARAMAKISMRLVPDQEPAAVAGQLRAYLQQHAPTTVTWELSQITSGPAIIIERDSPHMRAAEAALSAVFGKAPIFVLEGGSVPVVSLLKKQLDVDSIMLGFGLPDDNLHAPNEKLHLPTFFRGIDTYIHFFSGLG